MRQPDPVILSPDGSVEPMGRVLIVDGQNGIRTQLRGGLSERFDLAAGLPALSTGPTGLRNQTFWSNLATDSRDHRRQSSYAAHL